MDSQMKNPSHFGGFGPPARFRQRKNPVDAKQYDYRAVRTFLTSPNTVNESVIHMMMCALGYGLVTLHAAYMECGMWTSLATNLLLSCAVSYCACIQVWSAQKLYGRVQMPTLTYQDVVEAAVLLSPWPMFRKSARAFRYIVEGTLLFHGYGSCCVIVIMIGRSLKELVEGTGSMLRDDGDPPLQTYILSLMVPCAAVCLVTDLKYLAPFALVACVYAVVVIGYSIWHAIRTNTESPLARPAFKNLLGFFEFIGVSVFVLGTISVIILPIENDMDKPEKFHKVVLISMPIVTLMMVSIGFFGYWNYGELSVAPLTVHFPFKPFPIQLKVFVCLLLIVIFAINFYIAFDIEWFYLKTNHIPANYWLWERVYRVMHVIIITCISFELPNVTRMMGIIGGFFTSPAVFIYPPFVELLLDWTYPGLGRFKWRLIKCIAMILFGLSISGGGTYYNITGFILEWGMVTNYELEENMEMIIGENMTFYNTTLYDSIVSYDTTLLHSTIKHNLTTATTT